jgi:solute carrier family 25 carnitine/acylcarnitine transporter 20/29
MQSEQYSTNPKNNKIKLTFINTVKDTFNKEGIGGFFKGMSFPLYSVPLVNAIVFAIHELSKRTLGLKEENEMDMYQGILCGGIAGFANCIVVTPIELVKCRLQVQHENKRNAYYKGVLDCISKTFKKDGFKGLYRGNFATIMREVPAYSGQFGGYYYAKKLLAKLKNKSVNSLNNIELMICGAIGGYCCWQFSYPQDVIKTLLQTTENKASGIDSTQFKTKFYDGGFYNCSKYIYNSQGFFGFWRGYLPCTLRALIANSVLFVTYENSKEILSRFHSNKKSLNK